MLQVVSALEVEVDREAAFRKSASISIEEEGERRPRSWRLRNRDDGADLKLRCSHQPDHHILKGRACTRLTASGEKISVGPSNRALNGEGKPVDFAQQVAGGGGLTLVVASRDPFTHPSNPNTAKLTDRISNRDGGN